MQDPAFDLNDPVQVDNQRIEILELKEQLKAYQIAFQNQEKRIKELEQKNRELIEEAKNEHDRRSISDISEISRNCELSQFLSLHELEKRNVYKFKEVKTKPIKRFDCRILANSTFDLLRQVTWPIEFRNWEEYKEKSKQESVCVSVLGHEKMGKSFTISQLLGYDVPQGKNVRTMGLNILYPSEQLTNLHCIALDTPGTNVAIRTERMKKELEEYFKDKNLQEEEIYRRLYGDNIIMESLLHEFIVEHADVLLVVVDRIRRDDQQFVNSIQEKNRLAKKKKRILIIHNMSNCLEIEDVERAIQEDIIETYKVKPRTEILSNNRTVEVYEENENEQLRGHTTHIVMAHEGGKAGNYYNLNAIEYMRNTITGMGCNRKLDLIEAFHQHINKTLLKHFYTNIENPNETERLQIVWNENAESSSFMLNNAKNYDLKWNVRNELGILNSYVEGRVDKVPYTIKLERELAGTLKSIIIEFEVCGYCSNKDIKVYPNDNDNEGKALVVIIKGEIKDNCLRQVRRGENQTILKNTRSFGRFKIETEEIDLEGKVVDLERTYGKGYQISSTEVSGLIIVTIPLVESVNQNSDDFS